MAHMGIALPPMRRQRPVLCAALWPAPGGLTAGRLRCRRAAPPTGPPRSARRVDSTVAPPYLDGGPRPRVAAGISVWPGTVRAQGDGLVGVWALQARGHGSCSRSIGHTGMCASAGQVARLASVEVRARRPRARRRNQGVTGQAAAGVLTMTSAASAPPGVQTGMWARALTPSCPT
jgi:hypothetical protein